MAKNDSIGSGRLPNITLLGTRDFKEAQVRLHAAIDMALREPADHREKAGPTKLDKLVDRIITRALADDQAAVQVLLDRWAGKAVLVVEEKAVSQPVSMLFNAPRPERANGNGHKPEGIENVQ
jgi:hypothetical protein